MNQHEINYYLEDIECEIKRFLGQKKDLEERLQILYKARKVCLDCLNSNDDPSDDYSNDELIKYYLEKCDLSRIHGTELLNIDDRNMIIVDIKRDFAGTRASMFPDCKLLLKSMFGHVDNVRNFYESHGKTCPEWFSNKYGHLFVKSAK